MTHHHLPTQQTPSIVTRHTFSKLDFDLLSFFSFLFFSFLFFSFSTFALTDPIYVILEDHVTLTLSRLFPCPSVLYLGLCETKCTLLLRWLVVSNIVFTFCLSFCFALLHVYRYFLVVSWPVLDLRLSSALGSFILDVNK
ncbi:hypothetical protein BDW72DRAFT_60530 [Aspergillus terricola var. indicus]